MDKNASNAEQVRNLAGVLAACGAERAQGVVADVMAALDRDLADRIGHPFRRHVQESFRNGFGLDRSSGGRGDLRSKLGKGGPHSVAVQCLVPIRPEHARKEVGMELTDHQVCVGDAQRPAAAVGDRSRTGTRRLWADAVATAVET